MSDEAVEAAADAIEEVLLRLLGRDIGTVHRDEIGRVVVEAVRPHIEAWHEHEVHEWARLCRERLAAREQVRQLRDVIELCAEELCQSIADDTCPRMWGDNELKWCGPCRARATLAAIEGDGDE